MTTESFEPLHALENTPTGAENMKLRSSVMIAITKALSAWHVTQMEAARRLGITQPCLNDLLRDRIGKFSLDALVALAARRPRGAFGNQIGCLASPAESGGGAALFRPTLAVGKTATRQQDFQ